MESIIKHYQVAHVGFSLSYPDSSQEMMAVLLEAYQAFECDEQVASAALTSFYVVVSTLTATLRAASCVISSVSVSIIPVSIHSLS